MLLPQNGKEADGGIPGQGVLQAAVDGPHPQDEASGGADSHQQQGLHPRGTGLLAGREKGPSAPWRCLSGPTSGAGPAPSSLSRTDALGWGQSSTPSPALGWDPVSHAARTPPGGGLAPDLRSGGRRPPQQALHLVAQTAEALPASASLAALGAAGPFAAGRAVRAEAPSAEVVAAVQRDRLAQPLQADTAGRGLARRHGPGPQAQLQLGEWCVGPAGRHGSFESSMWGAGCTGQELSQRAIPRGAVFCPLCPFLSGLYPRAWGPQRGGSRAWGEEPGEGGSLERMNLALPYHQVQPWASFSPDSGPSVLNRGKGSSAYLLGPME